MILFSKRQLRVWLVLTENIVYVQKCSVFIFRPAVMLTPYHVCIHSFIE